MKSEGAKERVRGSRDRKKTTKVVRTKAVLYHWNDF